MSDTALLSRYAQTGSEDAFAELVRHSLPLVYGAALRRVGGDAHLAQDVAQEVFVAAARDAARLARHPNLTGWLFTTTRFLAAKALRTARRRSLREHAAHAVGAIEAEDAPPGEALQPLLDEALAELRELDRQMILLRFYRGLRLAEIARELHSSENAVQKRIERALGCLSVQLSRRGIATAAAALALALEQQAAVTLPVGLASAATTAGLAVGTGGGAGALAATSLVGASKAPLYALALVAAVGVGTALWSTRENAPRESAPALPVTAAVQPVAARVPPPAAPPRQVAAPAPAPAAPAAAPVRTAPAVAAPAPLPSAAPLPPSPAQVAGPDWIPLPVEYPKALFAGTPRPLPFGAEIPRADLLVPRGTRLLSRGKLVTSSDRLPVIGELAFVTDGDKSGIDGAYVELGPGPQWVQVDLGTPMRIQAIVLWHFHSQARVYHDVIVQASDDLTFRTGVVTLFNNDQDNSSRLGRGTDQPYIETHLGRAIDGRGTVARYVRLYSNGNSSDELNHYCEVEVHGTDR